MFYLFDFKGFFLNPPTSNVNRSYFKCQRSLPQMSKKPTSNVNSFYLKCHDFLPQVSIQN